MSTIKKEITLFSQQNGSDKVYILQMNEMEDGSYKLFYANGKRGQSLKINEKTKKPLTLEEAEKEFDKVVKSKKKGSSKYQETLDSGDTLELSSKEGQSGINTHLLVAIDESEALLLCEDDSYVAQEKHDGERRPLIIKNKEVLGTNRYGEYTSGMKSKLKEGLDLNEDVIFDTEDMGDFVYAFDILEYKGVDLKSKTVLERYEILEEAVKPHSAVRISKMAKTKEEKLKLLDEMVKLEREGLVFKKSDSPYVGGKATKKKATQFKYKLYDEASVIVESVNVKRSVLMALIMEDGTRRTFGNVTIPESVEMPVAGDIIEVKYLYAYKEGSIFQASFLKYRKDLRIEECKESQLKYKPDIV